MSGRKLSGKQAGALAVAVSVTAFVCVQFLQAAAATVVTTRENACRSLSPDKLPAVIADGRPPAFSLPDVNGKLWTPESLRGRPVVLNFWATWCAPCVEEMPSIESLARKLGNDAVVLAVSVDKEWPLIRRFFPKGTPLSVVLDAEGEVPKKFGTEKYPETFLIDRDGRIRHYFVNKRKWDLPEAVDCVLGLQ